MKGNMTVRPGFEKESIAFALAAGFVILDDQNGEKHARRARYERRKKGGRR